MLLKNKDNQNEIYEGAGVTVAEELKGLVDELNRDKSSGCFEIALYLVKRFNIKTIGDREREIFIYKDGLYMKGTNHIKKWLHELLEKRCTNHIKKEILEKVRDLSFTDRSEFEVDLRYINLNNGVFDLEEFRLLPHDPKFLFLHKIPVDYNPKAECIQIEKFLNDVLDKQEIDIMREFIGYGLHRKYFIKKALILVGEPNTGKTTFLNILDEFFGKENISGISLQRIISDKFSSAQLHHKHLNTFDDSSFKDINDTGAFKIATGGGDISAEYKFGNHSRFRNHAKLIFACNKIPDVKETDDEAYFSRWIVIRFNKEVDKVDIFLIDKLKTKEEMSGLLNFALEGLKRLLENQKFSHGKTPEEIKEEMMKSASSIGSFASDCLKHEPDGWISKEALYEAFTKYASENNLTIVTKNNFGKKLRQYANYVIDSKKKVGGKQITGWRNVSYKNEEVETEEDLLSRYPKKEEEEIRDIMSFDDL